MLNRIGYLIAAIVFVRGDPSGCPDLGTEYLGQLLDDEPVDVGLRRGVPVRLPKVRWARC